MITFRSKIKKSVFYIYTKRSQISLYVMDSMILGDKLKNLDLMLNAMDYSLYAMDGMILEEELKNVGFFIQY